VVVRGKSFIRLYGREMGFRTSCTEIISDEQGDRVEDIWTSHTSVPTGWLEFRDFHSDTGSVQHPRKGS